MSRNAPSRILFLLLLTACSGSSPGAGGGSSGAVTDGAGTGAGASAGNAVAGGGAGGATGVSSSGSGGSLPEAQAGNGGSGGSAAGSASAGATGGSAGAAEGGAAGGTGPGVAAERCDIANYDAQKPPAMRTLTGDLGTHDPALIGADGRFYLFNTGRNLVTKTSADLLQWRDGPEVFTSSTRPAWLAEAVPGVTDLWAPDISFFNGLYHLYYAASTFGSNHSCIGHLTRPSLSLGTWTDRGQVICSNASATKEDWNAIDPNVIVDQAGTPWLSFGSFWSGIKLAKLDQDGARSGTSLESLASRPSAGGAEEAPFIVRRCGFYYLFVSWDKCCKGADSTYNTRVGRSATLAGPYLDHDGASMLKGGGTLLVEGGERYRGPGHNAVIFTDTAAYNVYHAYDADNGGRSVLRIAELVWDSDGWPISAGP